MPFMGVQHERKVTHGERTFHVFTYQAYNAFGLIGPENNGVAICDVDKKQVLCDGIDREGSGYFGVSEAQVRAFERVCSMPWEEFQTFVNTQPSARYSI